ncbi:hypothetical protein [Flavobacterium branchiophilum]|uniref:Secretion system C-terminal sorting domain-containing protein n=1 Tax=Flavobacterium branchiophilum TaxID=55197 RepID=A0A2H3KCZ1_9FLAO|nr:hypothetical protein [Flavobacterium branchiophilum]PDS25383.1 hypothetical protein B0A77_05075 [Flavobacterium branchiophilum]
MKKIAQLLLVLFCLSTKAQTTFNYDLVLTPISVPNLPGLHSYAFGQDNGKWLIIGGRKDGIHARQPFNAFPNAQNNTTIYVVDVTTQQVWTASVTALSTGLKEQLQATNFNFYQDEDTLYISGGYAFSATANDHKTFANLTAVDVPNLIAAIVAGTSITPYFKQITHSNFAITGGQLGKMGSTFYLIGGHQFDGRYNPMNNPTFTQTYSNQIRKFSINNSGNSLSFSNYETVTDGVHLHRRDYNLVPQVFPDGTLGYTISSGVFQVSFDLPFLYPVDIKVDGYYPQTNFNQYLSHYHSGKVGLYNATSNEMHNLFFGGMSQYYYNGSTLIQDDNVPFVKTISRVSRNASGALFEYKLPIEMPNLKGSGAEFIPNKNIPHYSNEVIQLAAISENEFVIGHIYGGILSSSISAFTDNQTSNTSADPTVYEVKLVKNETLSTAAIDGKNPFEVRFSPNPTTKDTIQLGFDMPYAATVNYMITTIDGKVVEEGEIESIQAGKTAMNFSLAKAKNANMVVVTFIFDGKFYVSEKIIKVN